MVGQVDLLFLHENTSATSKVRRISPIKLTPTVTTIATPSELQKAEEFLALTRFREASDQLTGTLEPVVQDPPDFLITDGSRTASVEMTRYLQPANAAHQRLSARRWKCASSRAPRKSSRRHT
jgi:hypothetical protein